MEIAHSRLSDTLSGCLLGTAVGDALGLPAEGLSRSRQRRIFGQMDRHRLLFGRGMISDDTEHALMVAQALIGSAGEEPEFTRRLAGEMRRWLLLLPAGAGKASLQASFRLLVGVPPDRSGIRSAGNGPAMRAPLLGVCFGDDLQRLHVLVRASTRLTHTDPKAEYGALSLALAAHHAYGQNIKIADYLASLWALLEGGKTPEAAEMLALATQVADSVERGEDTRRFAEQLGLPAKVTGYIYHTVPVVLHSWFRYPSDFCEAVCNVIDCGGDTDTTAALVGGIVGSGVGKAGIPSDWLTGLQEWPRDVAWIQRVAGQLSGVLASGSPDQPVPVSTPAVLLRNLGFLGVVLYHGFRRTLPPY